MFSRFAYSCKRACSERFNSTEKLAKYLILEEQNQNNSNYPTAVNFDSVLAQLVEDSFLCVMHSCTAERFGQTNSLTHGTSGGTHPGRVKPSSPMELTTSRTEAPQSLGFLLSTTNCRPTCLPNAGIKSREDFNFLKKKCIDGLT